MAFTITLNFATETLNGAGDTYQLILVFTVNTAGGNETHTSGDKNIIIIDHGKTKWSYRLEEGLLTPTTVQIRLADQDGYIDGLLFGSDSVAQNIDKQFKVTIKLNGTEEFSGFALEDGIESDVQFIDGSVHRTIIGFEAVPKIDILNKQQLFDITGAAENPFSHGAGAFAFTSAIEEIYQKVNSSISHPADIDVNHSWVFRGDASPPISEFSLIQLAVNMDIYITDKYGLRNLSDVLKFWAFSFGSFTGMIHNESAFFKELFRHDSSNLQTLGTVLEWEKTYPINLLQWVRVEDETATTVATSGTETNLAGKFLNKKITTQLLEDAATGTFVIFEYRTPTIDATNRTNENAVVNFWHHYRGDVFVGKNRVDEFLVDGVTYDFLKDFTHDSGKYQIIEMTKDWEKSLTEFKALYLGT